MPQREVDQQIEAVRSRAETPGGLSRGPVLLLLRLRLLRLLFSFLAHFVEDGEQNLGVHLPPEAGREALAVEVQDVEEHLQRGPANLGARVERQLGEPR